MMQRKLLLATGFTLSGWLALSGDKTPVDGIVEPAAHPQNRPSTMYIASMQTASAQMSGNPHEPEILALRPRQEVIGGATESAQPERLFGNQSWTPPPVPPAPVRPVPPAQPTAPPLSFVYLGKKVEDRNWEVYLGRGESTYIVREQSVIDGMYRIESIKPPALLVTYIPLNEIQTLVIGPAD